MRLRERLDGMRARSPRPEAPPPRLPPELVRGRIVPALLSELAAEGGAERTRAALMALGRIGPLALEGGSDTAAVLVEHLDAADLGVATSACLALGVQGGPRAATSLVALLRGDARGQELIGRGRVPEALRAQAAFALGLVGEGCAITDLARFVRLELLRVLDDPATALDLRAAVVIALGATGGVGDGSEQVVGRLEAVLRHEREDDLVRAQAATSLGALLEGEPRGEVRARVMTTLLALLARDDLSIPVRQGALLALGDLASRSAEELDRRARSALWEATGRGDRAGRAFALLALARVASRSALAAGETPELDARAEAEVARETEQRLRALLAEGKALVRPWAALALGWLGWEARAQGGRLEPETRAVLERCLSRERSAEVAPALALAAGLGAADGAGRTLLERVPRRADGSYAALALGFLGHTEAVPALHLELRAADHEPLRLWRAASALALLRDAELVPELLAILAQCACDTSSVTLAFTLGHTGDVRVVEPLLAMLADPRASQRKRAWASYALGLAADRRPVPWIARYATRVDYLAATPSLWSPFGGGLLEER
ncbi:MAG TPA: hypothetical protein VF530_09795 [Planctomycetota bacterium]